MADRSVTYRLRAEIGQFGAQLAQASAATRKLGDDLTKVGKEGDRARRGLETLGRNAGRIGLAAAAGLGLMAAKAATFEQAMSNVAAATHESEANMRLLREAAIEAGAATQFSAKESADAITELAKAGVSTADILKGALAGALDLAAAGQIGVADAAENIATALTQFQLEGDKAAHVADLLAAGAGKAQGEVSDMALALDYAGVPAANLGVSIEETAGSIALFAKNGIVGEKAGTSLRGLLSSLTSPSKIARNEMQKLGLELFNSQGEFLGLAKVAEQLQVNLSGLTEEERANSLGRIFGNQQLQAANVLYREGAEGVRTWTANVNESGFAAETARIKTDNLRGDIERLGGAFETLLIQTGSGSQGFLRGFTQGLEKGVDLLNKTSPALQNTVTGMLAITAVTGGGLWFGSKVVRGVADTREALANLGPAGIRASRAMRAATTAGIALAGIAIASEGIKAIQRATDESLPGLNELNRQLIKLADTGSVDVLGKQFDDLGEAVDRLTKPTNRQHITDFLNDFSFGLPNADKDLREFRAEIDAIDKSLVDLVEQGHPDVAAASLEALGRSGVLTKDQFTALLPLLTGYEDAMEGVAAATELAAQEHESTATFVQKAGRTFRFTEDQIKKAREEYQKAREGVRDVGREFFNLGEKVDDSKVSLSDWIKDLEDQAEALANFTKNAQEAGEKGLSKGLIRELQKAGPAGALRLKQLADASEAEVKRANDAWKAGQDAIKAYVEAASPKKPLELTTEAIVIVDPALAELQQLQRRFEKHPKSLSTELKLDTRQFDVGLRAAEERLRQLREFTVTLLPGRREHTESRLNGHAAGGYITGPGTATSDSIPAYLSNGEYVIKAAAVARYGVAMFDRLNAMHFAQGGFVGNAPAIDYAQLAAAMSSGRQAPLANHVTVMPHDYNDFRQQESRIRSAAATDGWGR